MAQVTADKLLEDLRKVIHDAEELLEATAGLAGEQVTKARARAEASLQSARAQLSALGLGESGRVQDALATTDRYVRGNPWMAVGAGAAIGLLVGLFVTRRPRRDD